MAATDRTKSLRIALIAVGLICIVGVYPLTIVWPSGWLWHTGESAYVNMLLGIYATLGVFLIVASRDPLAHWSLVWFAVWSGLVHGGIMMAQALADPRQIGHLWGDVLALFVIAIVLGVLMRRATPVGEPAH